MTMRCGLLSLSALSALVLTSLAEPIIEESFDYPVSGDVEGENVGTGWTNAWVTF